LGDVVLTAELDQTKPCCRG